MRRGAAVLAAAAVVAALLLAPSASGSRYLETGFFDDAQILYGNPDKLFPTLRTLNTQVIRVNLIWGGPNGVATRRPANASNPSDPAYDWATYDRTVFFAATYGIKVVYSIVNTPPWANAAAGVNVVPKSALDLKRFAQAAARRYDGTYRGADGRVIPAVRYWLAWNEPNNPIFLRPQFVRLNGKWVFQSPKDYAKICNAIVDGVRISQQRRAKVGCGVTGPRGNNQPGTARSSVAPLAFLRGMKLAGARGFDAYAHHPYYGAPAETPATPPPPGRHGNAPTAVTLGNFDLLVRELTRLYGNMRIWITEYGYQTNPPDPIFGVTWAKQAQYLRLAWDKSRLHRRVDMFLWFLIQDEVRLGGWQSGLLTSTGRKKPAYTTFLNLRD